MLAQTIDEKKLVYSTWNAPKAVDIAHQVRYALWLRTQPGRTTANNAVRHAGCKSCPHAWGTHQRSHKTHKNRCTEPGCLCMELEPTVR